jgi:hypothetical protein
LISLRVILHVGYVFSVGDCFSEEGAADGPCLADCAALLSLQGCLLPLHRPPR